MDQKMLIGIGIGLIVGGVGGWFLGSAQAISSINKQVAAQDQQSATQVNAVGDVQTNPYEDVKTNPFDY